MITHLSNYIATTSDGTPVFYGYKDPRDFSSAPLSTWITIGEPKPDGSNYHRVPPEIEAKSYAQCPQEIQSALSIIASTYLPHRHWSGLMAHLHHLQLAHFIETHTSREIVNARSQTGNHS